MKKFLLILLVCIIGAFLYFQYPFLNSGLKTAYRQYKNGQIAECIKDGKTYYSGAMNAYDGGGLTFDSHGKVVGEYQGFTGKYTGIELENCKDIYVVEGNIWGKKPINIYNLK